MAGNKLCKLCETTITNKNKIKSHVVTKSTAIKPMQIDEQPLRVLGSHGSEIDISRFGLTDKTILCRNCDNRLSTFEDERLRLFREFDDNLLSTETAVLQGGYNSRHMKIAFLADLFRTSLSKGKFSESVDLGERHTEKIADIIRRGGSGSVQDYMTIIGKFTGDFVPDVLAMPERLRINNLTFYRFLYPGGWCALIKVDSQHSDNLSTLAIGANVPILNLGNILKSELGEELIEIASRATT